MKPVAYYKEKLENRQRELEARLHKIEDSLEEPVNPDVEDRATERENDEVLEGLGGAGLAELRMIQAAMVRIEKGEFGICVNCGEEISEDRLELLPQAPRCRQCA